ncbi:unnamed protein product [Rotaria socialis]|uniref:Uncharacterized protein n=1 Tax=Rotaria socialis TaxID=392032 RepID=A0A818Q4A0_9BILA|nr:unnamed protein product [Rotaria socialis]CAF4265463.1 unnamed protein product [Rotaria socialis]
MSSILLTSSFNSSITQENILVPTATTPIPAANPYDHQGAALYIAVILVWYSTGLAMMLFLQVRPRTLQQQFLLDSSNLSRKDRIQKMTANPFTNYRNIEADHTTKLILNELKDPERRQRLWKIYYESADKENQSNEKYYQTITSDSATIDRIKRRLADIHRMDSTHDRELPPASSHVVQPNESRISTVGFDTTKLFSKRFSLRRPAHTTLLNNRSNSNRSQNQQSTNNAVEMELLIDRKQSSLVPSETSVPQHNNTGSERFTVEKVSDLKLANDTINEDESE